MIWEASRKKTGRPARFPKLRRSSNPKLLFYNNLFLFHSQLQQILFHICYKRIRATDISIFGFRGEVSFYQVFIDMTPTSAWGSRVRENIDMVLPQHFIQLISQNNILRGTVGEQ